MKNDGTILIEDSDFLLDAVCDVLASKGVVANASKVRQANFDRAHRAGFDGCEVCGRALKNASKIVYIADCPVGSDCAKALQKLGYRWA